MSNSTGKSNHSAHLCCVTLVVGLYRPVVTRRTNTASHAPTTTATLYTPAVWVMARSHWHQHGCRGTLSALLANTDLYRLQKLGYMFTALQHTRLEVW